MDDFTIFVVADEKHIDFIKPFIYFARKNNPMTHIEIVVLNCEALSVDDDNTDIYSINSKLSFNQAKTLIPPRSSSKYVYISDIEMMIMNDISDMMLSYNFEIANACLCKKRSKCKLCSKCKFVDNKKFYDVIRSIDPNSYKDDKNLYTNIIKNNLINIKEMSFNETCPKPGVRIRLNRQPFNTNNDKVNKIDSIYKEAFFNIVNEESFLKKSSYKFKNILNKFIDFVQK